MSLLKLLGFEFAPSPLQKKKEQNKNKKRNLIINLKNTQAKQNLCNEESGFLCQGIVHPSIDILYETQTKYRLIKIPLISQNNLIFALNIN